MWSVLMRCVWRSLVVGGGCVGAGVGVWDVGE